VITNVVTGQHVLFELKYVSLKYARAQRRTVEEWAEDRDSTIATDEQRAQWNRRSNTEVRQQIWRSPKKTYINSKELSLDALTQALGYTPIHPQTGETWRYFSVVGMGQRVIGNDQPRANHDNTGMIARNYPRCNRDYEAFRLLPPPQQLWQLYHTIMGNIDALENGSNDDTDSDTDSNMDDE
jgi:hypothetical protein